MFSWIGLLIAIVKLNWGKLVMDTIQRHIFYSIICYIYIYTMCTLSWGALTADWLIEGSYMRPYLIHPGSKPEQLASLLRRWTHRWDHRWEKERGGHALPALCPAWCVCAEAVTSGPSSTDMSREDLLMNLHCALLGICSTAVTPFHSQCSIFIYEM